MRGLLTYILFTVLILQRVVSTYVAETSCIQSDLSLNSSNPLGLWKMTALKPKSLFNFSTEMQNQTQNKHDIISVE